jgi:hypothetical protein
MEQYRIGIRQEHSLDEDLISIRLVLVFVDYSIIASIHLGELPEIILEDIVVPASGSSEIDCCTEPKSVGGLLSRRMSTLHCGVPWFLLFLCAIATTTWSYDKEIVNLWG